MLLNPVLRLAACSAVEQHTSSTMAHLMLVIALIFENQVTSACNNFGRYTIVEVTIACNDQNRQILQKLHTCPFSVERKKYNNTRDVYYTLQVGFLANSLADMLGAVMPASRWRVCIAMWVQIAVLPWALFLLTRHLGNMTGVLCWAMGVILVVGWWLGVLRDHQVDDLAFLQQQIHSVRKIISMQQVAADALKVDRSVPNSHVIWKHLESLHEWQAMLDVLLLREQYLCELFHELPAQLQGDTKFKQ